MKKWMNLWVFFFISILASGLNAQEVDWQQFKESVLLDQDKVMGWCSHEKAEKLMELIHDTQPDLCVEVGVFGGASVYPMAKALSFNGKGVIHGIDPWAKQDCVQGFAEDDANALWWGSLDFEEIYINFLNMLNFYDIASYTRVLRMNSETAVNLFDDQSIDILHIDGNHSAEVSLIDVKQFHPKLKTGAYLWFDDADWQETSATVKYLKEHFDFIPERSVGNHCLLFKKI